MQRENVCTGLQTCRRVLLATRCCLCHPRLGDLQGQRHLATGGASEGWAGWCIERKAQSCLQAVRARLVTGSREGGSGGKPASQSSCPLGHLHTPRTQVPMDMNIPPLLCSACPGEDTGVPV